MEEMPNTPDGLPRPQDEAGGECWGRSRRERRAAWPRLGSDVKNRDKNHVMNKEEKL